MTGYASIPVGGGGFVTGMDFSSDGLTNLCRTDTAGAYILTGGLWVQLCTSARFGTSVPSAESGVIEIASAPSNSSIIYMYYSNQVFKSTDRGDTFTACPGWNTAWSAAANDISGVRLMGRKLAIDPVNSDCVIVCPQDSSAPPKITTNGGTTWASVPTIAAAQAFSVLFDTSGGTTGTTPNFTKNIFIAPRGSQMYRSLDAASTFTLTSSGPTFPVHLVTAAGVIWATDGAANSLWKYVVATNTWSFITGSPAIGMGGNPVHSVAVDPTNSSHIVLINEAGDVQSSTNSGGAWGSLFNGSAQTIPAGQPGWLGFTSNYGMFPGDVVFEPTGTTLYMGAGIGVWTLPPASPVNWSCLTAGIENLTSVGIVSPPGSTGHPVLVSWDRQVQYISSFVNYPSQNGVNSSFNFGWHADYAQASGQMMVALISGTTQAAFNFSSYSTDNGQTWTTVPVFPVVYSAATSISAATGNVLTFSAVPAGVYPGMAVTDTTLGFNVPFAGGAVVIDVTATTVTLSATLQNGGVGSGNTIRFEDGAGGAVAVSTPTNWMWVPSNNSSYPYYTTDGGSTWNRSAFPATSALGATPIAFTGTVNKTTGVITGIASTARLKVGLAYQRVIHTAHATASVTVSSGSVITFAAVPAGIYPGMSVSDPTTGGIAGGSKVVSTTGTTVTIDTTITSVVSGNEIQFSGGGGNVTIASVDSSSQVTMSAAGPFDGLTALTPIPSGWSNAYYDNTVSVAADSVTANKFYLYNTMTALVYVSVNSGATFTVASSSLAGTLGDQEVMLKSVPGKAGHLFLCAGNGAFLRNSLSGADPWTAVPNMSSIATFGFGKPKTGGGGYPIILATGKYFGVGSSNRVWRSDDGDQATPTWFEPTSGAATGLLDTITRIDGDKNVENQFYFSWHGSSAGAFLASGSIGPTNVLGILGMASSEW